MNCYSKYMYIEIRDCNPGPSFSIPGFGISTSGIPGSRDPGSADP